MVHDTIVGQLWLRKRTYGRGCPMCGALSCAGPSCRGAVQSVLSSGLNLACWYTPYPDPRWRVVAVS